MDALQCRGIQDSRDERQDSKDEREEMFSRVNEGINITSQPNMGKN